MAKKKAEFKIIFLTQGDINQASSRFRIYQYLEISPDVESSFDFKILPLPRGGVIRRIFYLMRVLYWSTKYDVVFIQKILLPVPFLRVIRQLTLRLVYDWDDALYVQPPEVTISEYKQKKRLKKLDFVIRLSDTVICGNQVLADYASKLCSDIRIIPTSVYFYKNIPENDVNNSSVTIGWIGRSENLHYLKQLAAVFNQLYDKYGEKVRLKVICDRPLEMESPLHVENKLWSLKDEETDILSFDIGIMPLEDTEWARGKCAFKLLQYMALGIPAVGSPVGANSDVISHGENGFLAVDDNTWLTCLSQLIEDDMLRARLASAARCTINEKYSMQTTRPAFMDAVFGN